MSFLSRLFKRPANRAADAMREGRYADAAALFLDAGEPQSAVDALVEKARQSHDPWAQIVDLRRAHELVVKHVPHRTVEVGVRLGEALVDWVDRADVVDRGDRSLLEEAAVHFEAAGELERAGDLLRKADLPQRAAEVFAEAGCIEKMDLAYLEVELGAGIEDSRRRLVKRYEHLLKYGDLLEAREAICEAVDLPGASPALLQMHRDFMATMPTDHDVSLEIEGWGLVNLVGGPTLTVGRSSEAEVELQLAGLSRRHLRMSRDADDVLAEDLDSKHGTTLDGAPLVGTTALEERGTLRLGEHCELRFARRGPTVVLSTDASTNATFVWGARWSSRGTFEPEIEFRLERGCWFVEPCPSLLLAGQPVTTALLLRQGTRLEVSQSSDLRSIVCDLRPRHRAEGSG